MIKDSTQITAVAGNMDYLQQLTKNYFLLTSLYRCKLSTSHFARGQLFVCLGTNVCMWVYIYVCRFSASLEES